MTQMRPLALLALLALTACGADGAPNRPGVTLSGSIASGVARDGG